MRFIVSSPLSSHCEREKKELKTETWAGKSKRQSFVPGSVSYYVLHLKFSNCLNCLDYLVCTAMIYYNWGCLIIIHWWMIAGDSRRKKKHFYFLGFFIFCDIFRCNGSTFSEMLYVYGHWIHYIL